MLTNRQRRPAAHGFLSLLPAESETPVRALLKEIDSVAHQARTASEHSRSLELDAVWMEESGLGEQAPRVRGSAQADHRLACERLLALAGACRRLIRWAALDWRPSLDVAGSGLTPAELRILVSVMGPEGNRPEVSDVHDS